jgi:hydroxyquinol 1,2-dioxygenase
MATSPSSGQKSACTSCTALRKPVLNHMIIQNQADVTRAVLSEVERAQDERLRTILSAAVKHMHAFVREVQLTEQEFHDACAVIAQLGKHTTDSHNEVVLMAGSLGLSTLVCLLNNGDHGQTETTANLLGPFWRSGSPATDNGASIVRSPTVGDPLFVDAWVRTADGQPVAGAQIDVWNTSAEGLYENQDPAQADMNLRGTLTTDHDGHAWFRTIKPAGYPVPVDGPAGDLLRTLRRHNMRPAHVHFLIYEAGFKTQFSQVYDRDDPNLETDSQFGVTAALVNTYLVHEGPPAPAPDVRGRWYSLEQSFVLEPGESTLPRPPISRKTDGERPAIAILERA